MTKDDQTKEEHEPNTEVYEIAIYFSRIWGIMETLEAMPNLGFEKIRAEVMKLAKEFVESEEDDFENFFIERILEIKKHCFSRNIESD